MRRTAFAFVLALIAALAAGTFSPAVEAATTVTTSPTVTVTPTTVVQGATATVSGTGYAPNYFAYVYFQRPDGSYNAFYVRTDASGAFTFQLGFSPAHGTGNEYLSAYDFGSGRWAPFVTIVITTGTPPPPTAARVLSASPNPVAVGQVTTITGSGFTPNNYVYFYYQRPDGTTNAFFVYTSPNGTFTQQLGFLRTHGCGTETVAAYDYGTRAYSAPYQITVTGC